MHQHLFAYKKSQTLAAKPLFAHTKTLNTLVGMGSAALAGGLIIWHYYNFLHRIMTY